jgi:hypothetical protein
MSLPRTARAAVGDYCYYVINPGNNRAVAFGIGRLDEPMAALLGLDASLRPIGRPQTLEEMQNVPILFPRGSQVAEFHAIRIVAR